MRPLAFPSLLQGSFRPSSLSVLWPSHGRPPRFYGSILSTCSLLSQLSLLRRRAGPRRILHLEDHPNWNHDDFQQFVRALETSSCEPTLKAGESFELYMFDIQDKTPERLKSTRRSRRSGDWLVTNSVLYIYLYFLLTSICRVSHWSKAGNPCSPRSSTPSDTLCKSWN